MSFCWVSLSSKSWCLLNVHHHLMEFKTSLSFFLYIFLLGLRHRVKTRVQVLSKMFPHLKLLCLLFIGPTLVFVTKQRNSFLIKFGVFYNKNKILTILFIVKYEKNHTFWWVFSVVGAYNQQFFAYSNEEKNKQKQERVLALVVSLWSELWNFPGPQFIACRNKLACLSPHFTFTLV